MVGKPARANVENNRYMHISPSRPWIVFTFRMSIMFAIPSNPVRPNHFEFPTPWIFFQTSIFRWKCPLCQPQKCAYQTLQCSGFKTARTKTTSKNNPAPSFRVQRTIKTTLPKNNQELALFCALKLQKNHTPSKINKAEALNKVWSSLSLRCLGPLGGYDFLTSNLNQTMR